MEIVNWIIEVLGYDLVARWLRLLFIVISASAIILVLGVTTGISMLFIGIGCSVGRKDQRKDQKGQGYDLRLVGAKIKSWLSKSARSDTNVG